MARSNKPILWLPFAGGGLVAALIIPVLILITGVLMPLGIVHLPHEKMAAFAHNPLGKLILFGTEADPRPSPPLLDSYEAGIVLEVMKDVLYESYVRKGKLRQAILVRRFFLDETAANLAPITPATSTGG